MSRNRFKDATVCDLEEILHLVNTTNLDGDQLTFLLDWASVINSEINRVISAKEVIHMIKAVRNQ